LHGTDRNAADYRDAFIQAANSKMFIVIAPEFSNENFPAGNGYNLGNVYQNGDNPSASTLNPTHEWSFSMVEPLFDYITEQLMNNSTNYQLFGHSAGAQFAHRFLLFVPNNKADKVVISAGGWYTFPSTSANFPYGFNNSILLNGSTQNFYAKNVRVQVGQLDNNPNESGLRRNAQADAQGTNRLERNTNFFNFCQQNAQSKNETFNWSFYIVPNANHNLQMAANHAANLIF